MVKACLVENVQFSGPWSEYRTEFEQNDNQILHIIQTFANNLTGYCYSKITPWSAFIRGWIAVRYLIIITSTWLRYQSFDNHLEDQPRVGTPISWSLKLSLFKWCPYEKSIFGKRRLSQICPKEVIVVSFMKFGFWRLKLNPTNFEFPSWQGSNLTAPFARPLPG